MINWIGALAAVVAFFQLLKHFRVIAVSAQVIAQSGDVVAILNNRTLSDLEKEKSMQRFSVQFFTAFLRILAGSAGALAIPTAALWLLEKAGALHLDEVMSTAHSWPFLAVSVALGIAMLRLNRPSGNPS